MNYIFKYDENISEKGVEPLLELESINYIKDENKISNYFFNLKTNEIEELEKIYDYSQKINDKIKNTINKDSWLKYKIANNITIPALSETIKKSEIKLNNDNSINAMYGSNGKFKELSFDNKKTIFIAKMKSMPLFEIKKDNSIVNQNVLFLHKEGIYKTDKEFFYMALNCLFSSNIKYYIKKCKRCGKFYLTNKINKNFCERPRYVCEKLTTCHGALKQIYKSKQYKAIIRKKNKHLDKFYKRNDEESWKYINNFLNSFNNILDDCKVKFNINEDDIKKINDLYI